MVALQCRHAGSSPGQHSASREGVPRSAAEPRSIIDLSSYAPCGFQQESLVRSECGMRIKSMNVFLKILMLFIISCSYGLAGDQTIQSTWAKSDPRLDTNPTSSFWQDSPAIYMDVD